MMRKRSSRNFSAHLTAPAVPMSCKRGDIGDLDPEIRAVAEKVLDHDRLMVEEHHQVGDIVLFEQLHDMEHDRAVDERDHRLGNTAGQRLNRVPNPPAIITAFMDYSFS